MNIWEVCNGRKNLTKIKEEPWRVVEAQHISSSRDLVDTLDEHELLEELIEEAKPPTLKEDKHYLIFSPFRYPPLKYGSRFGNTNEPSLWYGSLQLKTAFAEVAYYRLKFFQDTSADLEFIEIPVTAFQSQILTVKGIDLTKNPFLKYEKSISNINSYEHSQILGTLMRREGVEAFIYNSARCKYKGKNIGIFTSTIFGKKKDQYIVSQQNWRCIANKESIEFTRFELLKKEILSFASCDF